MFTRLLRNEEEREMYFIDALAIEISPKYLSDTLSSTRTTIPRYLKRVKRTVCNGKTRFFLLQSNTDTAVHHKTHTYIPVKIPAFEPITRKQFEDACQEWPCHFYNHVEDPLDQEQTLLYSNHIKLVPLLEESNSCHCSVHCLIFDGNTLLSSEHDTEEILGHAVLKCVSSVSRSQRGYLCTGYTAVMLYEPCLSCAMALVHGRIKKVIVLKRVQNGSFSKTKLNYNESLNHRFNVYFPRTRDEHDFI